MAQVIRSPKIHDVCVIGSGAGGGMAAKVLTEGGLNVALLEAGPPVNPEKDFKMLYVAVRLPHRGAGVGGTALGNFGEFLAPNGSWDIEGEPYTSAPGANFQWFRSRIVGGRTNHWGRIALRFAPVDFGRIRATALARTGPSVMRIWRRTTTKWNRTSACSARRKMCPARRMEFSYRLPSRAARIDRQEGLRQAEHYLHPIAAGDSHAFGQWPIAVPLLRSMRARMRDRIQFQLESSSASSGDGRLASSR